MLRTIRRGVLLAAAAGVTLIGLGLGQASAALPALPTAGLPLAVPALPGAALPLDPGALPTNSLPSAGTLPVDAKLPSAGLPDATKAPVKSPSVSNVDVAGLGSGSGAQLPHLNVVPNLGGTNLEGVTVPDASSLTVDKITDGSALTSLDATRLVPELNALQLLPQVG
jgi:hypothetical protein